MSDLAATHCGTCNDECGFFGGGSSNWIWILILLCCCNGHMGDEHNCGCSDIIPLILILSCCCGGGSIF
ncbi:MAG: chorion class high-cysteine HCB protein 13 [Lachnospiraceae bacterium]